MTTTLSIVTSAYRATLEEQDDTILWLNHMLANSGIDVSIVLQGNAVNYAVRDQSAAGLRIGDVDVAHPPALDRDVAALIDNGADVYYIREDLDVRGVPEARLVGGVRAIGRKDLPELLDGFDHVWAW